jgi:hypothetical protein
MTAAHPPLVPNYHQNKESRPNCGSADDKLMITRGYGPSISDVYRQAGIYTGRILIASNSHRASRRHGPSRNWPPASS